MNSQSSDPSISLRFRRDQPQSVCFSRKNIQIEAYNKLAKQFKQYVQDLSPKIDQISHKQNYRTYLKEQFLNKIQQKLNCRKMNLQNQILISQDPSNSPNASLYQELAQLGKMEEVYKKMVSDTQASFIQAKKQVNMLEEQVKKRHIIYRYQLKQSQSSRIPKPFETSLNCSFQSHTAQKNQNSYRGSRCKLIAKVKSDITQKIQKQLQEYEMKLQMLKFLRGYAKNQKTQNPYTSYDKLASALDDQIQQQSYILCEIRKLLQNQLQQECQ